MYWNNTCAHAHRVFPKKKKKCKWRFLTLRLSAKKDLLPFKMQFPETRHMHQIGPFPPTPLPCLPVSARRALWKPRPGFLQALWQAWASSLFFSDKEEGCGGGGGRVFCLPVWEGMRKRRRRERIGGVEGEKEVRGKWRRSCSMSVWL